MNKTTEMAVLMIQYVKTDVKIKLKLRWWVNNESESDANEQKQRFMFVIPTFPAHLVTCCKQSGIFAL